MNRRNEEGANNFEFSRNVGDLVSLDFKSQSLKKFLQNVVSLVNQHTQRINMLEMEKMPIDRIKSGTQRLIEPCKLSQTVLNTLPTIPQISKIDTYEDTIQGISINMKHHSHSIQYIYDNLKKKDQIINGILNQLGGFQKSGDTQDNIKKAIQSCKKYTDEQSDKILTRIKQFQMKTNKKIAQFQNTTKQIEKKTLWKISQCQSSLLKKVTAEYVDSAIKQVEAKIHNDIKINKNQELNQLKFNLQTVKSKLQALNKQFHERQKENQSRLKNLEENSKSFQIKQKAEQDNRQFDLRIKEILLKIDRLQKREDAINVEMRLTKVLSQHNQKLGGHNEKIKKLLNDLESIREIMSSVGGGGNGGFDPHKLCMLDGEIRVLKDSARANTGKLQSLDEQMKKKLLIFQQRIAVALGLLKSQDNFVNRQQLYESLGRLRDPVTGRMNEIQNLLNQLNAKLSKFEIFQKATKRKIKQLTRGDDLNKILDMKMGVQQSQTRFASVNMKLQNLQIIFNKIKMELQANSSFLQYLKKQINQPQEGINLIAPKNKVFPAKCLGCGIKHNPVHQNNMMMGSDGRYYKVDPRNCYGGIEERQVYGITASQITGFQNLSSKKIRATSAHKTTAASKTVQVRPTSAIKFL